MPLCSDDGTIILLAVMRILHLLYHWERFCQSCRNSWITGRYTRKYKSLRSFLFFHHKNKNKTKTTSNILCRRLGPSLTKSETHNDDTLHTYVRKETILDIDCLPFHHIDQLPTHRQKNNNKNNHKHEEMGWKEHNCHKCGSCCHCLEHVTAKIIVHALA